MATTVESAESDSAMSYSEFTSASLSVADVYGLAKLIGADVEIIIDACGKRCVESLMPKIVKVLELLESFAARSNSQRMREEELLRTLEILQTGDHKRQASRDNDERMARKKILDLQQELQEKEDLLDKTQEELQAQVMQLKGVNRELHSQLKGHHNLKDDMQLQELEETQKLREVVDGQRAELRAKCREIASAAMETEALQEQLTRFMEINKELLVQKKALQTQLRSVDDRTADMEADIREKDFFIQSLQQQLAKASISPTKSKQSPLEKTAAATPENEDIPCFTKQEVRQMIFERNELKANLFLLQEELSFYQREILNSDQYPAFLLDAVRTRIKKQQKRIKAKMLGFPADDSSSDEEGSGPLFENKDQDIPEEKPPESRIKNFFSFLTFTGNQQSPTRVPNQAWEIIDDAETLEAGF